MFLKLALTSIGMHSNKKKNKSKNMPTSLHLSVCTKIKTASETFNVAIVQCKLNWMKYGFVEEAR